MVLIIRPYTLQDEADMEAVTISTLLLPRSSQDNPWEQACTFELIRLAFFALKLHKLEQSQMLDPVFIDVSAYNLQCNLLQHVIFQQVLILTEFGARKQALQLIKASQDKRTAA